MGCGSLLRLREQVVSPLCAASACRLSPIVSRCNYDLTFAVYVGGNFEPNGALEEDVDPESPSQCARVSSLRIPLLATSSARHIMRYFLRSQNRPTLPGSEPRDLACESCFLRTSGDQQEAKRVSVFPDQPNKVTHAVASSSPTKGTAIVKCGLFAREAYRSGT